MGSLTSLRINQNGIEPTGKGDLVRRLQHRCILSSSRKHATKLINSVQYSHVRYYITKSFSRLHLITATSTSTYTVVVVNKLTNSYLLFLFAFRKCDTKKIIPKYRAVFACAIQNRTTTYSRAPLFRHGEARKAIYLPIKSIYLSRFS